MEKINLKNKFVWILPAIFFILLLVVFYSADKQDKVIIKMDGDDNKQEIERIGWITDLHTDNKESIKINDSEIIYSSAYEEYLPAFFEKMQSENIKTVVVTGDMTNDGESEQAENLRKIADNYDLKVLWVRGNHDRESTETMEHFDIKSPYYYYFDTKKTRVIVLNLTDEENKPDEKQLLWVKERLAETSLDVIIAMHIPIIDYDKKILLSKFEELETILRESGKVKIVISGSLHKEKDFFLDGIQYRTAFPFTLKDHEGSYYLIEVDNGKYEVKNFKLDKIK